MLPDRSKLCGCVVETLVCQDMLQGVKEKTDPGDLKVKAVDLHLRSSAAVPV